MENKSHLTHKSILFMICLILSVGLNVVLCIWQWGRVMSILDFHFSVAPFVGENHGKVLLCYQKDSTSFFMGGCDRLSFGYKYVFRGKPLILSAWNIEEMKKVKSIGNRLYCLSMPNMFLAWRHNAYGGSSDIFVQYNECPLAIDENGDGAFTFRRHMNKEELGDELEVVLR